MNMGTEEDTFNRLRRVPFEEMVELVTDYYDSQKDVDQFDHWTAQLKHILKIYYWDYDEYMKLWIEWCNRNGY